MPAPQSGVWDEKFIYDYPPQMVFNLGRTRVRALHDAPRRINTVEFNVRHACFCPALLSCAGHHHC